MIGHPRATPEAVNLVLLAPGMGHFSVGDRSFNGWKDLITGEMFPLVNDDFLETNAGINRVIPNISGNLHTITRPNVPTASGHPYTIFACLTVVIGSNRTLLSFGGPNANQGPHLGMSNSGTWRHAIFDDGIVDVSGETEGHPAVHWLVGTYDGTNGRLYKEGELIGGPTAFTFNGSDGTARFAALNDDTIFLWQGNFIHGGFASRAWSDAEVRHFFNPATRWDLYRELERVTYFVPVVVGANPKGPFGHPFHGPFGGPVA